ncbi:BTAD domain-containing putative transcriptional regulator, partial [Actinoplanes sp. NPDC051633]|uniref:AfsR/SARP family transcriptional regulator n=1 Tax=Actinoplanes sp. NPDC051633 TaxID=3155670 RepID=UPI00341B2D29
MTDADEAARVRFAMLGPLEVSGAEVTAGRERTVLAMLLLRPGRLVPAADLVDALWDDDPPVTAKAQLQTAVSRLRRRLPVGLIVTDPAGYALHVARHDLDALLFAEHMAQARALTGADRQRAATLMRAALDLWRGPALAGVESRLVQQRAAALDEEHGAAVEEWAELEIALGHDRAILAELTALVERFPLRERLRGQLMTALNNAGRQADALAEYRRARALLIDELGIEPGEELRRLHERILAGESTAAVPEATKPARVPRELPPEPRSFTARVHEVSTLDGLLDGEVPGTVVISAVYGTAGIGKTTLALHWGHRVAGRFPDGQLYVNLRGYDAADSVMRPDEALREFLHALEVPERRIPPRMDAQAALFRSILAGRRMLVVLDNARDADQVRPLLPASPGCMAVVTSRAQLTGLIATAGAHLITLGLLSLDEARQMLAGRLGEHRLAAEPEAVDRIIGACGHLPLALAIAAARALARPNRPLDKLAGELDDARLDALATGDPSADARAVFSWSYRALSPPAATLFRRAGQYPGPDFGRPALAALLGATPAETDAALAELTRAHLFSV